MKTKVFAIAAFLAFAAFAVVNNYHPSVDFSKADQKTAEELALIEEANAQNTPPIVVPSQLGIWGNVTLNTTGVGTPIAAPSASSTRNYVDQVTCTNVSSTQVVLSLKDGSTVKGYANCPPSSAAGFQTIFNPPLQWTGGVAVTVTTGTAAAQVYVNVHAYQSR